MAGKSSGQPFCEHISKAVNFREEGSSHLNFLYDELSESIILADAEIARSQTTMENSMRASMLLTMDEWDEEDEVRFKKAVFSAFELWGPKSRPVSLRRFIDDGKLDLIEKDLKKAILKFESSYVDAIEQTVTSYSYSLGLTPKITASMRFRVLLWANSGKLMPNSDRSAIRYGDYPLVMFVQR